jgi:hypothetical protein
VRGREGGGAGNLFAASVHDPVVAVKGQLIPEQAAQPRLRTVVRWSALETYEAGLAAFFLVEILPLQDLFPGLLVDGVVDCQNAAHVVLARAPALPLHGVVKHLFRRIDPTISNDSLLMYWGEIAFWDRRYPSFIWERRSLSKARVPVAHSKDHIRNQNIQ